MDFLQRKSQLKNLMKKERQDRTQKIDSPLAKYSSTGQLLCILCQTPVQSDALWDAHCKTKKHLESLVALKQAKAAKQSAAVKRTAAEVPSEDEQPAKRLKVTPLSQTPAPAPVARTEPEESAALVTYGEEREDGDSEGDEDEGGLDPATVAQLEREMMSEDEINKLIAQSRAAQQSDEIEVEVHLPEGFFDAQHVEKAVKTVKQPAPPAPPSDTDEWDKYQASLQVTGEDVSNARPDELEDDTRQEDDVDEPIESDLREELAQQESLLSRLMEIKKKAAEQLSQPKPAVPQEGPASDEEAEEELDPFDWRAKGF